MKTFTFTQEELEIIDGWYQSASGESASGISPRPRSHIIDGPKGDAAYELYISDAKKTKALLNKLGIKINDSDQYMIDHCGAEI